MCTYVVPYFHVTMSFWDSGTWGGGVFGCVAVNFYLCDGKPDIPISTVMRWGIIFFYILLTWHTERWWVIFVCS